MEWLTQEIDPPADNAQPEGDDANILAITPEVRLNNRTQIATRAFSISGTQQAMDPAGHGEEMGRQTMLAMKKLKTDVEYSLVQNKTASTSPRRSRGLPGWVVDNVNAGTGYVPANYITNVAGTDGTLRAFTETQLKDVMQKVFNAGGSPTTIMLGAAAKQTFSTFAGNATRFDKSEDAKVFAAVEVYAGDFGEVKAVPNRIQRPRDVFILDIDKFAVAYLRPFQVKDLAKTGDNDKKELIVEFTLEDRSPKSSGAIYDIQ